MAVGAEVAHEGRGALAHLLRSEVGQAVDDEESGGQLDEEFGDAELVVVGAFEGDWDEAHDVLRVTQLVYMLKPGSGLRLAADDSGGWRGGGGG